MSDEKPYSELERFMEIETDTGVRVVSAESVSDSARRLHAQRDVAHSFTDGVVDNSEHHENGSMNLGGNLVKSSVEIERKSGSIDHRFKPGNPGGPGRKKKDKAAFDAVTRRITAEQMADYIEWGIEKAKQQGSPKIVLAYAELYFAYLDGKPVQRIVETPGGLESVLAILRGDSD